MSRPKQLCELVISQSGFTVEEVAVAVGGDSVSLMCEFRCRDLSVMRSGVTPALAWYKEQNEMAIPSTRER